MSAQSSWTNKPPFIQYLLMIRKLSEITRMQEGYVNPPQTHPEYFDGDVKWLRAVDLKDANVFDTSRTLTREGFLSAGKSAILFKPGSIAISKSGTIARLGIICDYMCGNRAVINITPNDSVDLNYLFYWLKYKRLEIVNLAVGSVQKNLYVPILGNLVIDLPSLVIQRKIGTFLRSIDSKIETNFKINGCLDAQAEAIYRTMMLRLESEEATVGKLSSLLDFRYGKDHKQVPDGPIPIYGSGGIMRYGSKQLYNGESVLVPRKGSLNNVMHVDEAFWTVDTMFYSIPKIPNAAKFSYHFLRSMDLSSLNAGSAVPSMTTDILNSLELRLPSSTDLKQFEEGVAPLYEAISKSKEEIKRLVEIRDSLLPKLMSGEIDVDSIKIG